MPEHHYIHCPHCFGIDLHRTKGGYSGAGTPFFVGAEGGIYRCNECEKLFQAMIEYSEHKDDDEWGMPIYGVRDGV